MFRISLRIIYIIYDRKGYSNLKVIKKFKANFFPLFNFPEGSLSRKFFIKVLSDFIEINFNILHKKIDLIDFYTFFYSLLINEDETKNPYFTPEIHRNYFENFLDCIESLFKYELSLPKGKVYDMSYVKLLHNLFNMFYLEVIIKSYFILAT